MRHPPGTRVLARDHRPAGVVIDVATYAALTGCAPVVASPDTRFVLEDGPGEASSNRAWGCSVHTLTADAEVQPPEGNVPR